MGVVLKRLYDEEDLARYSKEKDSRVASEVARFVKTGLDQEDAESLVRRKGDLGLRPPKVSGVVIQAAGPRWNVSPELVAKAAAEGWLKIGDGKITILGGEKSVSYTVKRIPGYYCCHCGVPLEGSAEARKHVDGMHPKTPSPDKSNPGGYQRINHYETVRV